MCSKLLCGSELYLTGEAHVSLNFTANENGLQLMLNEIVEAHFLEVKHKRRKMKHSLLLSS